MLLALAFAAACRPNSAPTFAGSAACAECHAAQAEAWRGSDHQRAMQPADSTTVLGNFADKAMVHFGDTTRLFRRDGGWWENAEGPGGTHADYRVLWTFGVRPLQQYLASLPGGRLGVLPAAWDTRPAAQGGQRWFHLHPDEPIRAGDELHWTARGQVWNYQCAECHVTDYQKNYVASADSYATRWSEVGVGCEACHGPGSAHIAEARRVGANGRWSDSVSYGFPVAFRERRGVRYAWDPVALHPVRSASPSVFRAEVETCARCHSRRGQEWGQYTHGRPLMDTHRPELVGVPLYYPDGQIREEVYEYGSFLQSRMYQRGVTCSDCHDPHSGRLRATGNGVCTQCHLPARYDTPSHTFHRAGSSGSACVDCHMPPRTYMVLDTRRDHSLRIPRPDVTARTGSPNACNGCHQNADPRVAAQQVARWYGPGRVQGAHFADAFVVAARGMALAEPALIAVAVDPGAAPIVRATAYRYLAAYPSNATLRAIQDGVMSPDPLIRLGALGALDGTPPAERLSFARPLLSDTVRVIRLEAAAMLAGVPRERLLEPERQALDRALAEYAQSQQLNADQPWSWLNIGVVAAQQGRLPAAESGYRQALRLDSAYVPAWVNLADLYRGQNRDPEGEQLLRQAARLAPDDATVHYALALALVRLGRRDEAARELNQAAQLAPSDPRIAAAVQALRSGR